MPECAGVPNTFDYNGKDLEVSSEMKHAFDKDGFIVVNGLLSKEEVDIIEECVEGPDSVTSHSYGNDDGQGRTAKMCLWKNPGNDSTGLLARSKKMAGTVEKLLGDEVYLYHGKLSMKDAETGGQFLWHQDYGYWYTAGCVFPDMLTVFVALDRCGKDNGCLQVLRGSHRCGRIDHVDVAGQVAADPERVSELEKRLDKVWVELSPGDALFFHSNLVHTSSRNDSPHRRWALISCYNCKHNSPFLASNPFPYHSPLDVVDNDTLTNTGMVRNLKGKGVMTKKDGIFYDVDV